MNRMQLPFTLALCLLAAGPQDARSAPPQNCHAVSREACAVAHGLGRGINLGNMLEAPREGDWGVRLEPRFIELATRHFQTVRLPVRWSNHAAPTADARIDEAFARRVDGVVDALLARGVRVILNVHHYTQLTCGGAGGDAGRQGGCGGGSGEAAGTVSCVDSEGCGLAVSCGCEACG